MKKIILLFIIITISLTAQDINLNNKIRLAQSYLKSGMYEKAMEKYLELRKIQPHNRQIVLDLNKIYISLKEYDKSIELLKGELKQFQNDITIMATLGNTYYTKGDYEKAFSVWDEAIDVNPQNITNYRIIANYAIENRAFEKAEEVLKRAKDVNAESLFFSYDLAMIYNARMKYAEATNEYCYVLSKDEKQFNTVSSRISRYLTSHGAFEPSIEVVKEYIDNTGNPVYYELMSNMYITVGDFNNAYEAVIKSLKADGNESKLYNFGRKALSGGAYEIAAKVFNRFIETYKESQLLPSAIISYSNALAAGIEKRQSTNNIHWKPIELTDTTGQAQYNEVIEAYNTVGTMFPNSDYSFTGMYETGLIYNNKFNNPEKAKEYFGEVVTKSPLSVAGAKSRYELALYHLQKDDAEKAKVELERINKQPRLNPEIKDKANFLLAKILLYEGKHQDAMDKLGKLSLDLKNEYANDAILYSAVLNSIKDDSLSTLEFGKAELFIETKQLDKALEIYIDLEKNINLILLGELSSIKIASIYIAKCEYDKAIEVLTKYFDNENSTVYKDEALFLKGLTFLYGKNDRKNAGECFEKLLENFPNSLYLDESREILVANKLNENI